MYLITCKYLKTDFGVKVYLRGDRKQLPEVKKLIYVQADSSFRKEVYLG